MEKYEIIKIGEFELVNFTVLDKENTEMIRRWRNDPEVRKWMYNDEVINEEEHTRFIDSLRESEDKIYFLVKGESNYIGVLSFTGINWQHRRAYLGIYANPEDKPLGAGRNLMMLALEVAFEIFNLHSLRLEVIENNKKAIELYRKFGFKEEGRLRDFVLKEGKWLDVIVMGKINPKESQGYENR